MEQLIKNSGLPNLDVRSCYRDSDKPWKFELLHDVKITLSNGETTTIPKGFKSDFATVPRLLRGIVWGAGNHNLATLIHDWLYDNQYSITGGHDWKRDRDFADKEMLYWLLKSGCSKVKAYTMYYACRIGGKKWWVN